VIVKTVLLLKPLWEKGYELNQFYHSFRIAYFNPDFDPSDKFKYQSYFNIIKLGLAITFY